MNNKTYLIIFILLGSLYAQVMSALRAILVAECAIVTCGQTMRFTATAIGGASPYTFVWSDGVVENNIVASSSRIVTADTQLKVEVIDAAGNRTVAQGRSALSQTIFAKYCESNT